MYVAYPQQGHEARAEGEAVAVESWVPLPAECEVGAWKARYRHAALPHGDIRQRVLLARTRGGGATS